MSESQLYRTDQRPKPLKLKGERILYYLVLGAMVTVLGVYISSRQATTIEYGYELEELIEASNRLKDEQCILKSELAFLKDPNRILSKMSSMNLKPMKQQFWVYQNERNMSIKDEATLLE